MDTVPVHYTEDLYEVDDLSLHFKPEDWLVLPGGGREREGDTESGARLHPESRVFPSAFCLLPPRLLLCLQPILQPPSRLLSSPMLLSSLLLKPSLQSSNCQLMFHIQIYWHQALVTKTLVSNPPMVR